MKWFIASDIHGSAKWCQRMLDAYHASGADRLLLLGDLLYHGPRNDLPEGYAPKEVITMLSTEQQNIFSVRGNCDGEVDQMVLPFPILADYTLLEASSRLVFVTHGHHYHANALPPLHPGDILLYGHTHIPTNEITDAGVRVLNPGSVSLPKEHSWHGCMTLENGLFRWFDLESGTEKMHWLTT